MRTTVKLLDRPWAGNTAVVDFQNLPAQEPETLVGFLRRLNEVGHPAMSHAKRPGSWRLDPVSPEQIVVGPDGPVIDLRDRPDAEVRDRIVNGDLLDHPRWRMRMILSESELYTVVDHSHGNAPTMLMLAHFLRSYIAGDEITWKRAPVAGYRHLALPLALMYLTRKAKIGDGIRSLRESMATSRQALRGTSSVSSSQHRFAILPDAAFDDFTVWRKTQEPAPSAALGVLVAFLRATRRHGLDLDDFVVEGTVDLARYHPSMRAFGSNLIGYVSLPAAEVRREPVPTTSVRWNRALRSGAPGLRVLLRSLRTLRKPGPFRSTGERTPSPAARRLAYSYIRFPGLVDEHNEESVITTTQFRVAPGCINVTTDPVDGGQIINVSYDEQYVDGVAVEKALADLVENFIALLDEEQAEQAAA